jgi:hypothetical protein
MRAEPAKQRAPHAPPCTHIAMPHAPLASHPHARPLRLLARSHVANTARASAPHGEPEAPGSGGGMGATVGGAVGDDAAVW